MSNDFDKNDISVKEETAGDTAGNTAEDSAGETVGNTAGDAAKDIAGDAKKAFDDAAPSESDVAPRPVASPFKRLFQRFSRKKQPTEPQDPKELNARLKTNFFIAIIILVTINIVCGFVATLYFQRKTELSVEQAYEKFLNDYDKILSQDLKNKMSEKILKDYVREYYLPEDYVSIGLYVNQHARPSTVEVLSGSTANPAIRATGVILNSEGYIITNTHSITYTTDHIGGDINNPTHSVTHTVYAVINIAVYGDIELYEAHVIDFDVEHDLAIIKMTSPPDDLVAVKFGDSDLVKIGEETVIMGNTLGLGITVSLGSVMGTYNYENTDMLQLDAMTLEGNSGAGVYNPLCEMVGVVSFRISDLSETGSICYAVAANEIIKYISNVNTKRGLYITYVLSDNIK